MIRDFGFFALPVASYQRECFWHGQLPLWNPYNNCGVPFLAQWNTMPLYPPALIYLLLPLEWSLSFFCLLHLFWAGLGMYCLAYRWTGSWLSASAAGLIFAFNGLSLNLLMWPSHIATLSWMPWVIFATERGWEEGRQRLVLAAILGALQMLAGGPETILFTWIILLGLWFAYLCRNFGTPPYSSVSSSSSSQLLTVQVVGRASRLPGQLSARGGSGRGGTPQAAGETPAPLPEQLPQPEPRFSALWRFPLIAVLVAALAAAQLLPFLDLAMNSHRNPGFADSRWSMPTWGWMNFLVPMVFGRVWNSGVFFQHGQAWTSSYYVGVGGLLLALLGVGLRPRQRRAWVLAAVGVAGLALALGDQFVPVRWLRQVFPQLRLMTYPIKYLTLTVFAAPLLAAFGLARLQAANPTQREEVRKRLFLLSGVLLALQAAILLLAWRCPFPGDDVSATLHNGLERAVFLAGTTLLLLALQRGNDHEMSVKPFATFADKMRPFIPVALLLLLWLDVWTHEPPQNPSAPTWVFAPNLARNKLALKPQPELGGSRAMVSPTADRKLNQFIMSDPKDNFLVARLGCFANCNLLDRIPKVDGFFSLYPTRSGELLSALYGPAPTVSSHLADFMSVSQITSPQGVAQWQAGDSFLPLATAGQKPVFLDDTDALRKMLAPDFAGREIVLLPPDLRTRVSVTNQRGAQVISQRFGPERVDLEIEAPEASIVVVSQTWYHNWRAFVNGAPVPLLRADYTFQALQVPAGRARVRLVYEDRAFHLGVCISGLGLLACGALGLNRRRTTAAV